jgi:hypothetical protein
MYIMQPFALGKRLFFYRYAPPFTKMPEAFSGAPAQVGKVLCEV